MPPKPRSAALPSTRATQRKGGIARDVYDTLTSADNRSVVTSLTFFAAGVAFLHSSWSEILLPPV